MNMIIAAHVGAAGETISLNQPGKLMLFQQQAGVWKPVGEHRFSLIQDQGLRVMRRQMQELAAALADCKVLVAASVTGVPYYELERAGFSVWEFAGRPAAFLDHVLEQEAAARQRPSAPAIKLPTVEDLGNGCFRLSIKEIQESDSGLTTKQVLLPLLRRSGWYQFEILCSHVPPWVEAEAALARLACETVRRGPDGATLILRKPVCGE